MCHGQGHIVYSHENYFVEDRAFLVKVQVDAFASEAFRGNPAAVVFVQDQQLSDQQMQTIAAENNLSETAYLEHEEPGRTADSEYFASSSNFRLRYESTIQRLDLGECQETFAEVVAMPHTWSQRFLLDSQNLCDSTLLCCDCAQCTDGEMTFPTEFIVTYDHSGHQRLGKHSH